MFVYRKCDKDVKKMIEKLYRGLLVQRICVRLKSFPFFLSLLSQEERNVYDKMYQQEM